ncbi:hypothetical protein T12_5049 [Trichinella patagoniensis]|uniref:Uncharacterized protein n=1 Tax=Trichinella patagoniensis TaxID=990121 RepID=A0A0V0ZBG9_9BILA|nr:hypothetical protein T12_5049 [Trichinella patagoniensis]
MILKSRLKIFFFHFLQIIICFETCGLLCQPLLDNGSGGCSVQGTTTGVVEIEMSESTRSDNANETTTMAKTKKPLDLSNQDELISPEKTSKRRKQDSSGQSCTMAALQEAAGFPASSYLQSFAAIPANYGNYFASVDYANGTGYAGNPYLPGGAYDLPLLSNSDRARLLENSIKRLENDVLTKSLFQIDSIALKQLIVGYRDAAALLNRTADELEHFVSTKH